MKNQNCDTSMNRDHSATNQSGASQTSKDNHVAAPPLKKLHKRKRTKKAIETQGRILSAALELFRDRGFDKTSMRDIADAAGVAVGASYYYFDTKEELVLAYYEDACSKDSAFVDQIVARSSSFKERFSSFMRYKINQLGENRGFMNVLGRSAANPEDPLSPFSDQTKHIRDEALTWLAKMIEGSDLKASSKLKPFIPGVLWFYMMGLIFFWLHDRSPSQRVTNVLIDYSTNLVAQLFWLSSLPLTGAINDLAVKLFELILDSQRVTASVSDAIVSEAIVSEAIVSEDSNDSHE